MNCEHQGDGRCAECEAKFAEATWLEHNAADKWMKGEISIGKMIHEYGVGRPSGDDMAGAFTHAIRCRAKLIMDELEQKRMKAIRDKAESENIEDAENYAADCALIRAYTEAMNTVRYRLGHVL